MQNKLDLSIKRNIKYSLAFVLCGIPVTSYADFSFASYPYTLTNLHNLLVTDHQINTFSNYTINFTPVQTSGTVTTYEHQNPDSWIPISYTYTVTPNPGVVESTNITMTSNNQNITGYFHNMTSSNINGTSGVLNNLGTIAGDFVGNNQISQAGALSNNIWIHNLYGDFIDNSSNNNAGALENIGNIFRVQSNFIGNETTNHSGGAILNSGTVDYITGNFIHNTAHYMGGAIYNSGSINNLTGSFIDNSTYSGPGVYGDGGAISNTGTFTLSDSLFMNNSSYSGGAIASMGYGFNISDSQFIENSATDGGAIWNSDTATFNVNNDYGNMIFTFNQATRDGGAMYIANTGQTTLNASNYSNVSFTHNQADRYGGAVYNAGTMIFNTTTGHITFSDNEIIDNDGSGSAIYNAGTMTLTSNNYGGITFSNNGNGGAIYNTGSLTLNADDGNVGYIVFDNNSDYAITTSGTLNFTGNTRVSFLTDSDDIVLLNNAITNINLAAYVYAQDINGIGTVNNSGTLVVQGRIGTDVLINNTGFLALSATDVTDNITISQNGFLELMGGTLNYTPHYNGSLHILGDVISNVPIEQQEIVGNGGSASLHINADNIILDTLSSCNLYLTGGTLNHNISGNSMIITSANVSGGANNFRSPTSNDYDLTLSSGTLIANIIGNGNIITGGNILSNADNLGNNIINDYMLTLSGGTMLKNITGNGNVVIDGAVTINDIATVAQNITINENKQLSISASNINSSIIDNGTLTLTGGTLTSTNITGNGNILITGNVTSNVGINQSVQIAQNALLSINADNILNTISNNGTVALSGGTLNQQIAGNINIIGDVYTSASNLASDNITNNSNNLTLTGGVLAHSILGTGNTIINGNVTVSEPLPNTSISIANNITINSNAELHSHASAIQNTVQNNGELYLTGGTIENNIVGGNTIIDGIVNNNAVLSTSTVINADKSLSTSANGIGGTINNGGTLTLTGGTLNHQITGNGVINITDYTYTSADNLLGSGNIWNTSNLELTGGILQQVISGNGNTFINGNVQSSASNLYGNITINDGKTLTLTSGTLHSTISGDGAIAVAGNVEIDTDIYNDVSINSGAELHIVAGAIKNDIQNSGSLYITSSVGRNTIEHDITGGTTIIDGSANNIAVINNALLNTAITINSNKTLVSSADSIGGAVNNNGYLALSGGTITHNITGNGQTGISGAVINNAIISQDITVYSGDSLTTSADGIGADVSNYGNVILTGGILNHNITGGHTVTINGDVESDTNLAGNVIVINNNKSLTTSADNISNLSNNGVLYMLSNNGTLYLNGGTLSRGVNGNVCITGDVTNNTYQSEQINISNGGTFTTAANLLTNTNAISNSGTLNITSGNLQQNVTGGNTIIAQNATTSATNFGNLELNGVMNVGTNTVNMANADINGTINLGISALNKNSSAYTGGHIIANDITFGDNAKLSLTITDTNLQKGDSTGDLSIITANGTWTGDFADILTNNNLYDIAYNDNSHTFTFARKKMGADLITENNGTATDFEIATVWDELQSSDNQNVQSIINAIDYNSQHNAEKYATLIHNLAPHNNQVTVGAIRNVNTAINNRVTARLATVRTSTVTNNDVNRHQPNRYNRNPYYYMGYQGRSGGDVAPVTNNGLWVEGLYNYAQQNDDTKFSGKTFGVTGGFDSKLTEHLTAGLGYAFNKTTIDADNHDIDATGHTGFVYAEYKPTQWYVDALLSYNMTNYQDSSVLVDNLSVNSDYKTNSFGGSVISGYDFQKGYDLYGGLNYIGIKQDAYTDTAGQKIKADDTQTLTLTAGGKYRMTSQNMKKASTILKAAVLYDVMSDDGVTTVTVGNNNYIVRGNGIDPFGVQAGIMFDALGNNANLSIGYDLEWRNNFISHTGYIKLKYNF